MHRVPATGLYLAITLLLVGSHHADRAVSEAADSTIPSFELVTLDGEAYSDQSLEGQPTLLVFWAPWCNVCQRELPLLEQFYRQSRPALKRDQAKLKVTSGKSAERRGGQAGLKPKQDRSTGTAGQ